MELQTFIQIVSRELIALVIPAVAAFVVAWIYAKRKEVMAKLTASQIALLENWVQIVVQAAEQSGLANLIANTAEAKKKYAIDALQIIVDTHGFKGFSVAELEANIEAAILNGVHQPGAVRVDKAPQNEVIVNQTGA